MTIHETASAFNIHLVSIYLQKISLGRSFVKASFGSLQQSTCSSSLTSGYGEWTTRDSYLYTGLADGVPYMEASHMH